jgi:hypothetical protein
MKNLVILFSALFFLISCDRNYNIENYLNFKSTFDKKLIDQFPDKLICSSYGMYSHTNTEKNDVGFFLYQKFKETKTIDSLINSYENTAIKKYTSKDKCLLIVNRFETKETHENIEPLKISDSSRLYLECEKELFPIPNFIVYNKSNANNYLKLDDSFTIYVLESKAGNNFNKFNLKPFLQMPEKWRNGYSKGIAISKQNMEVIYWSIVW